jgi:hypothetical protein
MARTPTPADVQAERNQATQDYNSELQAVVDRTAKLRAERLARESDPNFVPVAAAPKKAAKKAAPAKPAKTKAKAKTKSASKAQKAGAEPSPDAGS